jgi:hypothetical protein
MAMIPEPWLARLAKSLGLPAGAESGRSFLLLADGFPVRISLSQDEKQLFIDVVVCNALVVEIEYGQMVSAMLALNRATLYGEKALACGFDESNNIVLYGKEATETLDAASFKENLAYFTAQAANLLELLSRQSLPAMPEGGSAMENKNCIVWP